MLCQLIINQWISKKQLESIALDKGSPTFVKIKINHIPGEWNQGKIWSHQPKPSLKLPDFSKRRKEKLGTKNL